MAKAQEYCSMDALLPNVQKAAISMGAVGGPPGQLQGRSGPRHRPKETLPERGALLSGPNDRRNATICARI